MAPRSLDCALSCRARLDQFNGPVGPDRNRKNPTVVFDGLRKTGMPERYGFRKADFERAMNALFRDQKIKNVPYGRKGDERTKIAVCSDSEGGKERQQPA